MMFKFFNDLFEKLCTIHVSDEEFEALIKDAIFCPGCNYYINKEDIEEEEEYYICSHCKAKFKKEV